MRNSASLCAPIIESGALRGLAALVGEWASASSDAELQPCRIALFSLGSMCSYAACRDTLLSSEEFANTVADISARTADEVLRKYAQRVVAKLGL